MSQTINLNIRGLYTYPSDLSGVPPGALKVADNVNISRSNIVEPRRGFDFLAYDPTAEVKKLFFYNSGLFAHYGTTFGYNNSGWTSKGTLSAPSNATSVRSAAVSKNLYLTNSDGVYKLDSTSNNIYAAGIPKGTMIESNGALTGSGTAVASSESVAYRYIVGRKDANNNTFYGGVSARYVVTAGGAGPYDVPLKVFIPSGLSTSYFCQVYRTAGTVGTPNDEMQLIYEVVLDGTMISNGYFTFTDIVPDDLLGASLYTSPSQQGIVNDNAKPPLARDLAEYKNHLFFGDVTGLYRQTITLIAVGGTYGLAANDTLTITRGVTTEVYTAKAAASVVNKEFLRSTAGTAAVNIDTTTRSLISVINQASALVYAYLLSDGSDGLPGKLMIEERTNSGTAFTVISSNTTCWNPSLASTVTSTNDDYKNGLMWSKQGIPEAVPLKNILFVGASDNRIKRIVPLRDGLFIFKETDGVYVLRGENESSFSVSLLDSTAKVKSPDSLAVVNNLIYGLFDAGIGEVSDSGFSIIGLPIKDEILDLYGTAGDEVETYAFGLGYDVEGKYILNLPSTNGATACDQQYVFDVYGRTFCRWTLDARSMLVSPSEGKIYYGAAGVSKVKVERKSFDYTDYVDYGNTCTITAYSTTTVTINNTADMAVGDLLVQGDNLGYIESIDLPNGQVTIDAEQAWTLSTADVEHLKAIDCRIEWNAEFAGNPAGYKQFYECSLLFKQGFQKEATVYFYSDTNPGESSIEITSSSGNGAWGEFAWGDEAWGGEVVKEPTRLGVPREVSRCNQLSVRFESRVGYSDFQLNGLSLSFNPISTRAAR